MVKRGVKTFPAGAGVLRFGCSSPGVVVGFPDTTLSAPLTLDPQCQIEISNQSILGLTQFYPPILLRMLVSPIYTFVVGEKNAEEGRLLSGQC